MGQPHGSALERWVGSAAARRLRRARSRKAAARPCCAGAFVALFYRRRELVVCTAVDAGDRNGGGSADQDLEQHADRDEPRAASATAAQGSYGCAQQPDQSALSFQYA